MSNNIEEIKKGIFEELLVWDKATTDDCEYTEPLTNFYNLWNLIWKLGWGEEYVELRGGWEIAK